MSVMGPYWITELACIYISTQAHGKYGSVSSLITNLFFQHAICTALSSLHRAGSVRKHFADEFPAHPKQCLHIPYIGAVTPGCSSNLFLNNCCSGLNWEKQSPSSVFRGSPGLGYEPCPAVHLCRLCCWDFLLDDCSQQLLQLVSSSE